MEWNIRNSDEMALLRADLLTCPVGMQADILADYMADPVVALGHRLSARISALAGGRVFSRKMLPDQWRSVVENVVPDDGRHPDAVALRRFLEAASRGGWCDPRNEENRDVAPRMA